MSAGRWDPSALRSERAPAVQGWRRSMEDAHIAVLDLGNNAETAMFGVFDGHGGRCASSHQYNLVSTFSERAGFKTYTSVCSEVAKFCQKYMAEEITKLEHYQAGRLRDGLVEVFHKIDLMLRDEAYSTELATLKQNPRLQDATEEAPSGTDQPTEVNTVEAMALLRKMLAIRKQGGEGGGPGRSPPGAAQRDEAQQGVTAPALSAVDSLIQAGCTAVVAVFQASPSAGWGLSYTQGGGKVGHLTQLDGAGRELVCRQCGRLESGPVPRPRGGRPVGRPQARRRGGAPPHHGSRRLCQRRRRRHQVHFRPQHRPWKRL